MKVRFMEELKRVIYTLESERDINYFEIAGENARTKLKEKHKEREALFHRWGDKIVTIDGQYYHETYGIVQEIETGEIKSVFPTRIKFI